MRSPMRLSQYILWYDQTAKLFRHWQIHVAALPNGFRGCVALQGTARSPVSALERRLNDYT